MIRLFNEHLPSRPQRILDESSNILNWDHLRNKAYEEMYRNLESAHWVPEEVSMAQDAKHWVSTMTPEEKETYKTASGQLAVLDTVSTSADLFLLTAIKDPAVRACLANRARMEAIHNRSYTYILSSFCNEEEKLEIFERPKHLPEMLSRNKLVFDQMEEYLNNPTTLGLVKYLVASMVLENLYFTCGFSYFFHLARMGKMTQTQSVITFIFRDENFHSQLSAMIIRDLVTEYPEEIDNLEFSLWIERFIRDAVELEIKWGDFLYQSTPSIDMTEMRGYVRWRANIILQLLGLEAIYPEKQNPMLWINTYLPENANQKKTDFFENKVTNYTKVGTAGDGDAWDDL